NFGTRGNAWQRPGAGLEAGVAQGKAGRRAELRSLSRAIFCIVRVVHNQLWFMKAACLYTDSPRRFAAGGSEPGSVMSLIDIEQERLSNPVDMIEQIAALHDWSFERAGDHELTISVGGDWCDY